MKRRRVCVSLSRIPTSARVEQAMANKLTIEHMIAVASSWGGRCLSTVYVNSKSKLEFECSLGHEWSTTPNHIRQGHWCPRCGLAARTRKLGLDRLRQAAATRGGLCRATEYVDVKMKVEWECALGHRWLARPNNVLNAGTWCGACALDARRKPPGCAPLNLEETHVHGVNQ
jgi:hypothetical protein